MIEAPPRDRPGAFDLDGIDFLILNDEPLSREMAINLQSFGDSNVS
jgi:hypothetical protein